MQQEFEEQIEETREIITDLIRNASPSQIASIIKNHHEADIADALEEIPQEERINFFRALKPEIAAEIFEETEPAIQIKLLKDFTIRTASRILGEMYTDDIADVLGELSEENKELAVELLESLDPQDTEDVTELLTYAEDSAGGLMSTDYIAIPENLTVKEAIDHIKKNDPPEGEISFYIYITDEKEHLLGMTSIRNLLLTDFNEHVTKIREDNIIFVNVDTDQEEVAKTISRYDLYSIPVVDENNVLRGVITADDVIDVMEEENTEDIYKMAGTVEIEEEKLLYGHLMLAVKSRIAWLLLTVVGGFISAALLKSYSHGKEYTIDIAILLSFIPMLMGMGGNVGNQSCTIIVRGIATGHIKKGENIKTIIRELKVGTIIGLMTGTLSTVLAFVWQRNPLIGIIVGIAMWANITTAAIIGTILPLIFRKVGIDPAVASAPFISTTVDITGIILYFSVVMGMTSLLF